MTRKEELLIHLNILYKKFKDIRLITQPVTTRCRFIINLIETEIDDDLKVRKQELFERIEDLKNSRITGKKWQSYVDQMLEFLDGKPQVWMFQPEKSEGE